MLSQVNVDYLDFTWQMLPVTNADSREAILHLENGEARYESGLTFLEHRAHAGYK